jgi:regulatory protein
VAGQITAIRIQKRNNQRANIFIDDEFAFSLDLIEAAKLSKGQYLDDSDIAALRAVDESSRAYERALDLLSYRPRSRAEVARSLQDKGFAESTIDDVLGRLIRSGLLDDRTFARYWIENREQFRPRGPFVLRRELQQKGIADAIIQESLQDTDERASAYRAAMQKRSRWQRIMATDPALLRRKLFGYLKQRGFGYDAIQEVWERFQSEWSIAESDLEESEETTTWQDQYT